MSRPDAAAYVLGLLDGPELERARELERDDTAFAADVAALRATHDELDALSDAAWAVAVPPPLALPDPPRRARRTRSAFTFPRPVVAALASVLLLAGAVTATLLATGEDGPAGDDGGTVTLAALPGSEGATGTATVTADGGRVLLDNVPSAADGGFVEVWLLNSAQDLVSVGAGRPDADGRVEIALDVQVDPRRFRFVDVSAEPADGNPAHSGRSLLRGPVTA